MLTRPRVTYTIRARYEKAPPPKTEQPNTQKTQSLQDIIDEFGLITSVHYKPFKCEPK